MSRTPYKYLDYYTFDDADLFFGREEETQKMVGEILSTRLLVLFSPSGSGKTSLINAGVRPALEKLGYETVYVRLDKDPIPSVQSAVAEAVALPNNENNSHSESRSRDEESVSISQATASKEISRSTRNDNDDVSQNDLHGFFKKVTRKTEKPLVIFIDQFEEFFIVFHDKLQLRRQFIEQVAKIKYDDSLPVFLVLSLREDYFANLHEFREAIPSIFQNNANIRLEPFTEAEARRAIEEPAKVVGCEYEAGLVDRMLQDLKNGKPGIEPITLQIVCNTVWGEKAAHAAQITFADYKAAGGADHILSNYVSCFLDNLSARQQSLMAKIFATLKTPDDTKRYRTFEDLQVTLKLSPSRLKRGLDQLVAFNLLRQEPRAGTNWYEFKHDYLVGEITDWLQARRERLAKRRLWYGLSPGVTLLIGLLVYLFVQYNSFYAGTVTPAEVGVQEEEIAIFRVNPFHQVVVTTGYRLSQVRDDSIRRAFKNNDIKLGFREDREWTWLANKLKKVEDGKFLYRLGELEAALDTLLAALKDEDYDVSTQAAAALVNLGQSDDRVISALLAALKDDYRDILGNYPVRIQAAAALVKLGKSDDRVISALLAALKDQDWDVRDQAAAALVNLGQSDDHVISALLAALKDQESYVSTQAAAALVNLGQSDDRVISALLAALKDQDSDLRSQAAEALGNLGQSNDRVISALLAAIKDQDSYLRSQAAEALGNLDQSNDRVISALLAALKDDYRSMVGDYYVRSQATAALGNLGQSDERVISTLFAALNDQDSDVCYRTAAALANLGQSDERVISALLAALKDKDKDSNWYVRREAIAALVNLGQSDDRVISTLFAALIDDNDVRREAMAALGKFGKSDDRIISGLFITALTDYHFGVRSQAAAALVNLGQSDDRVISALLAALKDEDEDVRTQAAAALGNLLKPKFADQLFELLTNNFSGYRTAGAQALARKDSLSPALLTRIDQLRQDDRPWVRLAAWDAYELIQARLKSEAEAKKRLHQADSVFASGKWQVASGKYESAFGILQNIIRVDSVKTARAKFQQARCAAKLKRVVPALDDLKMAFEYNPTLRDTLQAEMVKPENDWKILAGNWYLREVLLKR